MKQQLSEHARRVLNLAQREAHDLNHDYVGTEHLLLAILVERPEIASMLGISVDAIRGEIAKVVLRGLLAAPPGDLPLTPRARRVIDQAVLEAIVITQSPVEVEHLLVGLINEPDGIAGQALRNLGLSLEQVRREMHKLCLEQMAIVERAVRPIRCGAAHRRKVREELLAHLNGIFEEERTKSPDAQAALASAAKRFGDPVRLAQELQKSLPRVERFAWLVERYLGWRPPESATRMMLRSSLLMLLIMTVCVGAPLAVETLIVNYDGRAWVAIRFLALLLPVMSLMHFVIGVLAYRIRDSLYGVFGSTKSLRRAVFLTILLGFCVLLCSAGAIAAINGSFAVVAELNLQLMIASIGISAFVFILVRSRGPMEIRDVVWACLDIHPTQAVN